MRYKVKKPRTGSPKVLFGCVTCGTPLTSPLEDAGKREPCPICGTLLDTPGVADLEEYRRELERLEAARVEAEEARARRAAEAAAAREAKVKGDQERARQEQEERARRKALKKATGGRTAHFIWTALANVLIAGVTVVVHHQYRVVPLERKLRQIELEHTMDMIEVSSRIGKSESAIRALARDSHYHSRF